MERLQTEAEAVVDEHRGPVPQFVGDHVEELADLLDEAVAVFSIRLRRLGPF